MRAREMRQETRAGNRGSRLALAGIGALALSVATLQTSAFAHNIIGTTPQPSSGVVGTTELRDSAQVSADDTRDVVFFLWAPSTCGQADAQPVFTDTEEVTTSTISDSTVTTSNSYVPQQTGSYQWTAEIVVDDTGAVESGPTACGDEPVSITKAQPSIVTDASPGGPVGIALTDSATVSGGFNPSAHVSFYLFGPNNTGCHTPPGYAMKWVVPLRPDGTASTTEDPDHPSFVTTAPGVYEWKAFLSADSNNLATSTACGEEEVTVTKASPAITTQVGGGGVVGSSIFDTATVSGGDNPTGTVTFQLFAPADTTCDGDALQTVTVSLQSDGTASSESQPYTTQTTGTYHWIATYNGDANNDGATSRCADEPQNVGLAGVQINTSPSAGGTVGTAVTDTATITGGDSPTGTVTFSLHGPDDATCSGTAVFTSADRPLVSGSATSESYSGTATAGTYRWIATYSGDANNASATSECSAESVVITPASGEHGITGGGEGVPSTGSAAPATQGFALLAGGVGLMMTALTLSPRRRRRQS